jgi:hypothetical protein
VGERVEGKKGGERRRKEGYKMYQFNIDLFG